MASTNDSGSQLVKAGGAIRSAFARITLNGTVRSVLGVAGVSACVFGAFSLFGFAALPTALKTLKGGDLFASGLAGLVAAATPSGDQSRSASRRSIPAPLDPALSILHEQLRYAFYGVVLDTLVALVAYIAIGIPLALLVTYFARNMPLTAGAIVACYAYIGLARFIGFTEMTAPFHATPPTSESYDGSAAALPSDA